MKTHYRRISKTAISNFQTSLTTDGRKPGEYEALGSIGAVTVGIETAGWKIIEVCGPDSDDLPGNHVSDSFGGLKGAARKAVHRAKIRETVDDGEGNDVVRVRHVPENKIPDGVAELPAEGPQVEEGDAVLAVGINPHRFI